MLSKTCEKREKLKCSREPTHGHKTVIMAIYPNQKECGDRIVDAMFHKHIPCAVLLAQMQMGKSGTYWHVIFEALVSKFVDNVLIISGNREKDLAQQVRDDVTTYCKEYCEEHPDAEALVRGRIKVLWGAQLFSKKKPVPIVRNRTLIVWDEAHYAQSKSNAPYQFFKHNQLDAMLNGSMDIEDIRERGVFMLNVSATPFSQLYANALAPSEYRTVVRLRPDDTYCGMKHYMRRERIHPSFEIVSENMTNFAALLGNYVDSSNPRYILVRVHNTGAPTKLVKKVCADMNVAYKTMNCKVSTITIPELKNAPTRPTVVVISGMLRMGKVVPKEHVAMVFEAKTAKDTRNADTGLQGLLGRMCGYAPTDKGFDIDIYVEPAVYDSVEHYIQSYDNEFGPLCEKAMNLKKTGRPQSEKVGVACVPIHSDDRLFDRVSGKVSRPAIRTWILENMPEVPSLLVFKNLLAKTNHSLEKKIAESENQTIEHKVKAGECYVCKKYAPNEETIWLVYGVDIESTMEMVLDVNKIMDKCVYKPDIQV